MELKSTDVKPVEVIREQTRSEHTRAEEVLSSNYLDKTPFNENDLKILLQRYYGLYKSIEEYLLPLDLEYFDEFTYDERTSRLNQDLKLLGMTQSEINKLPVTPLNRLNFLGESEDIIGCLYVIEGSEHGNAMIQKQLQETLDDDALRANHFFHGDHQRVRERWNQFTDGFNDTITSDTCLQKATTAAKLTFNLFASWFS